MRVLSFFGFFLFCGNLWALTCLEAKQNILNKCCINQSEWPNFPLPGKDPKIKTYTISGCGNLPPATVQCYDGSPSAIPANGSSTQSPLGPDSEITGNAACTQAFDQAKLACNTGNGDILAPNCSSKVVSTVALPFCSDVAAIHQQLKNTNCEALEKCRIDRTKPTVGIPNGSVVDCIDATIKTQVAKNMPNGSVTPDSSSSYQGTTPSSSNNSTPPFQDITEIPGFDPSALNAPMSTLRLQLPGNFLRFYVRNTAIASGLKKVSGIKGLACDSKALACALDPIEAAGFLPEKDVIEKDIEYTFKTKSPGVVNVSQVVYKIHFEPNDKEPRDDIIVHWDGEIDVKTKAKLGVDFNNLILGYIPMHDPLNKSKDKNNKNYNTSLSPIDSKASYLDRTLLFTNLSYNQCAILRDLKFKIKDNKPKFSSTSGIAINGASTGVLPSYKCECAPPSADAKENEKNQPGHFCIADPYPAQFEVPVKSLFPNVKINVPSVPPNQPDSTSWIMAEVRCSQALDILLFNGLNQSPKTHTTTELRLQHAFNILSIPEDRRDALRDELRNFGCNGQVVRRMVVGSYATQTTGWGILEAGEFASSAVGFSAMQPIQGGKLEATFAKGGLRIEFPFFARAEEWVEQVFGKYLGFVFKLIIKFVRFILEGVMTALVNYVAEGIMVNGVPGNTVVINAGSSTFAAHGLLLDSSTTNGGTKLSASLKRLRNTQVQISFDKLDYKWATPSSCQNIAGGFGTVWEKLVALVTCPVHVVTGLGEYVLFPIKNFIMQDSLGIFGNLLGDEISAFSGVATTAVTKLETSSEIASIIKKSFEIVTLEPNYTLRDAFPPLAQQNIPRGIPAPLNLLCGLDPNADLACGIVQAVLNGSFNAPGAQIIRLGSMTHYRSMTDYGSNLFASDWNFPTVRYCVSGDFPSGTRDYSYGQAQTPNTPNGLLATINDIREIRMSATGSNISTDYRNQCTAFVDTKIRSHNMTRPLIGGTPMSFETVVLPSIRTNYLINEVFVCRDNEACDMNRSTATARACAMNSSCDVTATLAGRQAPLRLRAELAMCSLAADVFLRFCQNGDPATCNAQGVNFRNALTQLNFWGPVLRQNLISRGCAANPQCAPLLNAFDNAASYGTDCAGLLRGFGYTIRPVVQPNQIPAEFL